MRTITIPANKITIMHSLDKAVPKRKATKAKQAPIKQVSWDAQIGPVIEGYFAATDKKDQIRTKRIYKAFVRTVAELNDEGINCRHVALAALDLARILMWAQGQLYSDEQREMPSMAEWSAGKSR
jgi:hypothetical protein